MHRADLVELSERAIHYDRVIYFGHAGFNASLTPARGLTLSAEDLARITFGSRGPSRVLLAGCNTNTNGFIGALRQYLPFSEIDGTDQLLGVRITVDVSPRHEVLSVETGGVAL